MNAVGEERRLSLRTLVRQKEEIEKDLRAFKTSYDVLRSRLSEAAEIKDVPSLTNWSGTNAVMGSLELSITSLEKELADYTKAIYLVQNGEIANVDDDIPKPPVLKLVPEEQ